MERFILALPPSATFLATLDINLAMALVGLLMTIALAPRYFNNRELREDNKLLNVTIETRDKIIEGNTLRLQQLEADLAGATARANANKEEAVKWEGKHDAIKPYTAEPAFKALEKLIDRMDRRHEETHNLIRRLAGELSIYPHPIPVPTDLEKKTNDDT